MNIDTAQKFIEKIIERTKNKIIPWNRMNTLEKFPPYLSTANAADSFYFYLGNGGIVFLVKNSTNDTINLYVNPGENLPTQRITTNETLEPLAIRLYNIVYSLFPNIDSVMEEFINQQDK